MDDVYPKPRQFPDCDDFALCVDQAEKWVHKEHVGKCQTDTRYGDRGTIYCQVGHDGAEHGLPFSLRLTLTEESLIARTIQSMRTVVSDTAGYHVDIALHDDGNCLVIVKYSSIIGSRYVCAVPIATILPVLRASLERQTRDELRRRAKVADIAGRGSMNKSELVVALLAEMAGE